MDYIDLVQERIAQQERDLRKMKLASEARRLGLAAPGPVAHFDRLLIRVARGANQRQARRTYASNHREGLPS